MEGYAEVKALRNAGRSWENAQQQLTTAQRVVDALAPKKAAWDAMTEAEQESAPPEAVWTRKDGEDWDYQQSQISKAQATIDEIEATYSVEELTESKNTFNAFVKSEIRNHEDAAFRDNYRALEADRKQWSDAKNQQDQLSNTLGK